MTQLLNTATTLWNSVSDTLRVSSDATKKAKRSAETKIAAFHKSLSGGVMTRLLSSFCADQYACTAVLKLAGALPMELFPAVKQSVFDGVHAIMHITEANESDGEDHDIVELSHAAPLIGTMCSWEQEVLLLDEIVTPSLERVSKILTKKMDCTSLDCRNAFAALDVVTKLLQTENADSRTRTLRHLFSSVNSNIIEALDHVVLYATTTAVVVGDDGDQHQTMPLLQQQLLLRAISVRCMIDLHALGSGIMEEVKSVAATASDDHVTTTNTTSTTGSSSTSSVFHTITRAARNVMAAMEVHEGTENEASTPDIENRPHGVVSPPRHRVKQSTPAKMKIAADGATALEEKNTADDGGRSCDAGGAAKQGYNTQLVNLACVMVTEKTVIGHADEDTKQFIKSCVSHTREADACFFDVARQQALARLAFAAVKTEATRAVGVKLLKTLDSCCAKKKSDDVGYLRLKMASRKVVKRFALKANNVPLTTTTATTTTTTSATIN
jgi:hypothetical protein